MAPGTALEFGWLVGAARYSDPLAAVAVGGFLLGAVLELAADGGEGGRRGTRSVARAVTVGAWVAFGAFWLSLVGHFWLVQKSAIEGVGVVLAVGLSLSGALALARGRDSLFVLSRAIGLMGLVYLPFVAIDPFAGWLAAAVTRQTELLVELVAGDVTVASGATVGERAVRNTFVFYPVPDHRVTYTVRLACTGLGSIAMFAGAVAAVRAPVGRKLRALAVSVPVIWVLNVARNAFIAVAFGEQRLHVAPELVLGLFGAADPYLVSYFLADRVLAQTGAVLALAAIALLVVRTLPGVTALLEEALYLLTRREVDLRGVLAEAGIDAPGVDTSRPDGRPGD